RKAMNMCKVSKLQAKMFHAAKQSLDRRFGALYDKIYREDVLLMAWKSLLYCRKWWSCIKKGYTLSWFEPIYKLVEVQIKERSIAMKKIETKKTGIVNWKTLIATIDIGKIKNMGYWRCPDGTECKPFEFFNDGWGFRMFWNQVSKAMKTYNLEEVVIGFESTGAYGEPLVHFLRKKPAKLVQVNPMHTKRVKELQGNSPNKTDHKDPKVIADIISLGNALTVIVPEGAAAQLRRLTQARERWIQKRTALLNQLQELIFVIFPESVQVMKGVKTKSARHLLTQWPTPEAIVKCGVEALTRMLKKVSQNRLGKERAEALYHAALQSVGVKEGRDAIILEINEFLSAIEGYNRFITKLEEEFRRHLKEIPYSKFILSLKGIGVITAAGLIGEVGDFRKFDTVGEITKLAGLDLFEVSSGKQKGQRHISKRGRPLMRKLLYFAAINVVRKGGIFHDWYQRALDRGMIKMKALVAVSRKLLRIIFALVRDHSEYMEDYVNKKNVQVAA
ncbi:MAG: IS110 family transposase, partial [Pseudomonadota bacterium]